MYLPDVPIERVRIGVVGVGWIGAEVARASLEDPRVELVGVADTDPHKVGRDLGEVIGEGRIGLVIDADLSAVLARERPEVVIVCASSDAERSAQVASACLDAGCHVVLTTESLASPSDADRVFADGLDQRARERGVVVMATGVNPGFAMDRLPVTLAQQTRSIRRVRVRRVVDLATRRAQLQAKAGVGLTPAAFKKAMAQGRVGHVGLDASVRLIARGLDLTLEAVSERLEPLVAAEATSSSVLGPLGSGRIRGIRQVARGHFEGQELISLELVMALDEPSPMTTIDIVGIPPLHLECDFPGDACTVASVLSAVGLIVDLKPGLRTVLDLPAARPEAFDAPVVVAKRKVEPRGATTAEKPVEARGRSKTKKAIEPSSKPATKRPKQKRTK